MSQLANASATSLNFVGFEDVQGQGMPTLLYNQVFIEPNRSYTAGVGQLAAAGFVPGTQSYLKQRRAIWSQSSVGKQLAGEGFVFAHEAPMTAKQIEAKFHSEAGGGQSGDLAWGQAMPRSYVQGDESGYTHPDNYVSREFFP